MKLELTKLSIMNDIAFLKAKLPFVTRIRKLWLGKFLLLFDVHVLLCLM